MSRFFRSSLVPLIAGLGFGISFATPSSAQFFSSDSQPDTVIMIGGSPEEWSYYSGYWQQLMDSTPQSSEIDEAEVNRAELIDPQQDQAYLQSLSENVVVKNLRQQKISRRFGTSQVVGTLTNQNRESVVVQGVNFEIRTSTGKLLQTGSAVPQPNLLAPGQTVTFSQTLLTIPINRRFQLDLLDPAVVLQPRRSGDEVASQ